MTKLCGWETLFHGTTVAYALAGPSGSLPGCNRSVEEIDSIRLILLTLRHLNFFATMIMSGPGLE